MFWFNKQNPSTVFLDKRIEQYDLKDKLSKGGIRKLVIKPDVQADYTNLPFRNNQFSMVVFDPPHSITIGQTGWLAKKYGKLDSNNWAQGLHNGFMECFRVLRPEGTLIFKWSEIDISISKVLACFPEQPLFGNRSKINKTHWYVFMKLPKKDKGLKT